MNSRLKKYLLSFLFTAALLVILDLLVLIVIPSSLLANLRPSFHIFIICYWGLTEDSGYLPVLVLLLNIIHSAFTVESWAVGTMVGILLCLIIGRLKTIIDTHTNIMLMTISLIFHLFWYFTTFALLSAQMPSPLLILGNIHYFILQALLITAFAPFLKIILDQIWGWCKTSVSAEA